MLNDRYWVYRFQWVAGLVTWSKSSDGKVVLIECGQVIDAIITTPEASTVKELVSQFESVYVEVFISDTINGISHALKIN